METTVLRQRVALESLPFSAFAVPHNSPAYLEACLLLAERYTRACMPRLNAFQHYQETINLTPLRTIPLVIKPQQALSSDQIVGTARLELPPTTTIEAILRFQPDSPAAAVCSAARFAEVGAFAIHPDLDSWAMLDVLDAIAGAVVQLAEQYDIEELWVFPRRAMMGFVLASIPDLLPHYQFERVSGAVWNEDSAILHKIRMLCMKDLHVSPTDLPLLYRISTSQCAADVARRLALRERRQQQPDLPRLLRAAQRRACEQMVQPVGSETAA